MPTKEQTPPGLHTREELGLNEPEESQKGSEEEDGDEGVAGEGAPELCVSHSDF